jgi:hypothetical protein
MTWAKLHAFDEQEVNRGQTGINLSTTPLNNAIPKKKMTLTSDLPPDGWG